MAKQYGFDQSKVTMVNLNPSEGVVAASKGDVDVFLGWQPNLYRLVKLGGTMYATGRVSYVTGTPEVLPFERRFQFNNAVLLASEAWIKEKPNTLKAVLRALNRATDLINRDRNAALKVLEKEIRVDRDALEVMVNANVYSLALNEDVAASIKDMSEWALGIKRIPRSVTPEEGIHTKLLEEVDARLVTWRPKR
jgi:NitT/TauT family transport system substrate-binding protein